MMMDGLVSDWLGVARTGWLTGCLILSLTSSFSFYGVIRSFSGTVVCPV